MRGVAICACVTWRRRRTHAAHTRAGRMDADDECRCQWSRRVHASVAGCRRRQERRGRRECASTGHRVCCCWAVVRRNQHMQQVSAHILVDSSVNHTFMVILKKSVARVCVIDFVSVGAFWPSLRYISHSCLRAVRMDAADEFRSRRSRGLRAAAVGCRSQQGSPATHKLRLCAWCLQLRVRVSKFCWD